MSFLSYVVNLPAKLGRAASTGSLSVTLASDDAAVTELAAIESNTAASSTAANQSVANTILAAIVSALAGVLSVNTANKLVAGNLTVADPTGAAAGSTVTINTDSLGALGIKLSGAPVGAQVLFQGSVDGVTWDNPKAYPLTVGSAGVQSAAAAGDFEVNCAAFKQFRVCLAALTSGSFAVVLNGTAAIKHIGVKNGNATDLQITSTPVAASSTPDRSGTINGTVSGAAVVSGGSGYVAGNTITLANGIVLSIAAVSAGAVATVTVATPGNVSYANVQAMANPVAQASSNGGGTGATFILTWAGIATLFAAANSSRKSLEIINPGTATVYAATTIASPAPGIAGSIPIAPGGSWQPPLPHQGAVYIYGATAGQPVTVFEG